MILIMYALFRLVSLLIVFYGLMFSVLCIRDKIRWWCCLALAFFMLRAYGEIMLFLGVIVVLVTDQKPEVYNFGFPIIDLIVIIIMAKIQKNGADLAKPTGQP